MSFTTPHGSVTLPAAVVVVGVRLPRALRPALGPVRRRALRDREGRRPRSARRARRHRRAHRPRRRARAGRRRRARLAARALRPALPAARGPAHPRARGASARTTAPATRSTSGSIARSRAAATAGACRRTPRRASASRSYDPEQHVKEPTVDAGRAAGPRAVRLPGQLDPAPAAARRAGRRLVRRRQRGPLPPAVGGGHPHRVLLRDRRRARDPRGARRRADARPRAAPLRGVQRGPRAAVRLRAAHPAAHPGAAAARADARPAGHRHAGARGPRVRLVPAASPTRRSASAANAERPGAEPDVAVAA